MDNALALTPRPERVTSAVAIYKRLHALIVSMALPPGTALQDKILSAQFAVSRTPVREALIRLAEDELVDIFPQSGTFVSRIKVGAIPEALAIREALENVTVGRAAACHTEADLDRLDRVLDLQASLAAEGDTGGFHEADERFHETIGEISTHRGIWRLVKQVKVQIDRTRRLTLPVPGRMPQVIAEHRAIRDAIAAGNAEAAQAAMMKHLGVVLPDLERLRREYPDYFA
ncbi:MAG TPA: GntR family transcriptional regulator [Acidisoma sp.]|uniref:GntR family transcriptional regulator n=1 Tax=Acidisoma sp. TaxID=1872115 RepID=UPI002BC8087F|nr:GntR family transcriptional regulator [Acidisoma sp.]HTI00916.1 GntR family transcriptional regulator [Acidisoma sp.]